MKAHYWQGEWLDDAALEARVGAISAWAGEAVRETLDVAALLEAADEYSRLLLKKQANHRALKAALLETGRLSEAEAEAAIAEAAEFLSRDRLEAKLTRELGSTEPFVPGRVDAADARFDHRHIPVKTALHFRRGRKPLLQSARHLIRHGANGRCWRHSRTPAQCRSAICLRFARALDRGVAPLAG